MNYHNILHDDMLNGDGLRVTLFVSGCSLHCPECHNPQTHDQFSGIPFDAEAVQEICTELSKPHISGLTLTGGHPLEPYNIDICTNLCMHLKNKYPTKTIWLYTGYLYENIKDYEIMNYVDVLVDGVYIKKFRDTSLKWRGSSNQRVIDVKESKEINSVVLHCD